MFTAAVPAHWIFLRWAVDNGELAIPEIFAQAAAEDNEAFGLAAHNGLGGSLSSDYPLKQGATTPLRDTIPLCEQR